MSSVPNAVAAVGTWTPVRLGLIADDDAALEFWRVTHRACVNHLRHCVECGMNLCPDGQTLWDAADDAERELPWRMRP